MSEFTVTLPGDVEADEAKLMLALKLFERGRLSAGQAAQLAGFSKGAFLEMAGRYGVPVFNYSVEDLSKELEHD